MEIIRNEAVETALRSSGRTYLCGNLSAPNGLEHIPTDGYEIGISYYAAFSADKPHIHTSNAEYNYVLEGELKVLLLREGTEYCFQKGDLFVIHPDEPYIGKALAGTRVLFSKVPGGNDKNVLPLTDEVKAWCADWNVRFDLEGGKL